MNVLKKRFFPYLLACVMVLSMVAPAFAGSANRSTVVDGQYVEAVIDVVIPTTARAFINPYALPVQFTKLNAEATAPNATEANARPAHAATAGSVKDQQIVTEPMFITNKSEVALAVTAKVTGTINPAVDASGELLSKMKFVSEALGNGDQSKNVFAYLQMEVAEDLNKDSTAGALVDAFTDWTNTTFDSKKDIIVSAKGGTLENGNLALLRGGVEGTDGSLNATNGSIAMFRITGQVAADPKVPWDKTVDTFKISIAFTFKPDPNKLVLKASPNLKRAEATSDIVSLTASMTGGAKMSGNVTWACDASGSEVNIKTDGSNNVTCVVMPQATGTKKSVTVTATVKADNGFTYTASFKFTVDVPT